MLDCTSIRDEERQRGTEVCLRGRVEETDGSVTICNGIGAWSWFPSVDERLRHQVHRICPECTEVRYTDEASFDMEGCFVWRQGAATSPASYRRDRWFLQPAAGTTPTIVDIVEANMRVRLPGARAAIPMGLSDLPEYAARAKAK